MSTATLPKAVQRQLEEAERIERAIAERNTSQEPAAPAEGTGEPEAAVTPEAPAVETPTQVAAGPEDKGSDDAAYWRRRFDTVQGMLTAEAQQRKTLADKLDQMQRQVEQMHQAPAKQAEPLVSAKDEEVFGSELIDLARRAAREEFSRLAAPLVSEMRKELNPVREQVGKVAERVEVNEHDRFFSTLGALVPEWEQINADTRWLEWLAEVDPMLGAPRQVALDSAHNSLDVQRVAAVFNTWKNQFMPTKGKAANRDLERQITPPKSSGGGTPSAAPKIWTRAEYERAFDPRLIRTLSQVEVAQMQADADRAHQEGRIRW